MRTLVPGDEPGLLVLLQQALVHDRLSLDLIREKVFQEDRARPELSLVHTHGGRVTGFAMGLLTESRTAVVKLMAVAPELQGQALAKSLLRALESQFQHLGAERFQLAACPPNYLWPGVDVRYQRALRFFERAGYRRTGRAINLCAPTRPIVPRPDAALPEGISVRRADPGDQAALTAMLAPIWPQWIPETKRSFLRDPVSLFLAWRGHQLLAFAGYDCNNIGTGWFGPMGTLPEARGLGLGSQLLQLCVRDLAQAGQSEVTIPWVGPSAFYQKTIGATFAREFVQMEKSLEVGPRQGTSPLDVKI